MDIAKAQLSTHQKICAEQQRNIRDHVPLYEEEACGHIQGYLGSWKSTVTNVRDGVSVRLPCIRSIPSFASSDEPKVVRMLPMNQSRWSAEETAIAASAEIATMSSKNAYDIARSDFGGQILKDYHDHFRKRMAAYLAF